MNKEQIRNIIFVIWIIILLFCIITMSLSTPISYETKSIRLMTWNVEWLFMKGEIPLNLKDDVFVFNITDKIKRVSRQIIKINPEICCLQEISSSKTLKLLRDYIFENYGGNYYFYIQEKGGLQKIGILSKIPIRNFNDFNNFVSFSIFWKQKEIVMYGVHLRSRMNGNIKTEKDRINALHELYTDYEKYQNKPILIMGDFNDNFGSNSMNYLSDRKLINLMYTKKFDGNLINKYTFVIDRKQPISMDNVRDLDHIYTNYNLYNDILDTFVDHSYDDDFVSDHWPVVVIIQ